MCIGSTPVMRAASKGRLDVIQELLAAGADPCLVSPVDQDTTLHQAAQHGHLEIVDLMLSCGIPVNAIGYKGSSPLIRAACGSHTAVVRRLLEAGNEFGAVF